MRRGVRAGGRTAAHHRATDRRSLQRVHVRGPRRPAGPQQHARLLPQQTDLAAERELQLGLSDGALAQITTSRGTAQAVVEIDDRLQPGRAALPNGFGLDLPVEDGATERTGVALNTLTELTWRDPIAGTPWHKHVPARIAPLPA
ncbi:molybdopterin dinucleotide binding domain-containing protein [Streptomyces iakyrus]|uniref:molybdopterin dinucleotide binding domain-containing protein n=1 Tax=Streptomyces iakyrus TaxID=68219 RepID=UPI0036E26211